MTMTDAPLKLTRGPWTFVWHGGRLMDVFHAESDTALDCVQAGPYDWQAGKSLATVETAAKAADGWVKDLSDDYKRELPYLDAGRRAFLDGLIDSDPPEHR